jgi:hypothetical protein
MIRPLGRFPFLRWLFLGAAVALAYHRFLKPLVTGFYWWMQP